MMNSTDKENQIIDPESTIQTALQNAIVYDNYWKDKASQIYEAKLELTDPLFVKVNHLRQAFRYYIIPVLKSASEKAPEGQKRFVLNLPFLFDEQLMSQFLFHYYSVKQSKEGDWEFLPRDVYEQDTLLLYDLYKVKRTINGILELLKIINKRRDVFPSIYQKSEQIEILKSFNSALFLAFKFSIKPEHQVDIFKNISLDHISEQANQERRDKKIVIGTPNQLEGLPYRRVFLNILFRNKMKTVIKNKSVQIKYNLISFEHLVSEFLNYYLNRDNKDMDALKIHHSLHIQGKTLSSNIIENPTPELIICEELNEIKSLL